ncbi:hypothetical protein PO903_11850 [Paenibacillus sp. PK4536]|uniref:Lipoprotein n=1 Tax=Paenibacillus nuruki TaxID=1886670 RepID=A0A1E3L6P9_9BACL|nr:MULTISPECIES: hypothetical protein [Paenibacillus]ODP28835.1 hypothetical protein PTI45_01811 [Paenibacillus nuruki]WIM37359.1 hypothetical protein PO903_11850 [Paenibacillus sp. PK4536]
MKKTIIVLLLIVLVGCENQSTPTQPVTAKVIRTPDRPVTNTTEAPTSEKGLTTDLIEQYEAKEATKKAKKQQKMIQLHVVPNTDAEYQKLQAQTWDNIVIAKVNINQQKVSTVRTWIDHYRNGQFKEQMLYNNFAIPDGEKEMSISSYSKREDNRHETVVIMIQVGLNSTSLEYTYLPVHASTSMSSTLLDQRSIPINTTVDLSMRVNNDGQHTMTSSNLAETIKNNKEVFVLRAKWVGLSK